MEPSMSDELNFQPGLDETAVVERVVPGKLVYVTTTNDPPAKIYGFKLNQLVIRKADGSCRPYRGEPLSDLGVDSGRKVVVWGIKHKDVKPALVIDADRPKEFSITIGSSISNAMNVTIGKILK
jgi:hypothetical protein